MIIQRSHNLRRLASKIFIFTIISFTFLRASKQGEAKQDKVYRIPTPSWFQESDFIIDTSIPSKVVKSAKEKKLTEEDPDKIFQPTKKKTFFDKLSPTLEASILFASPKGRINEVLNYGFGGMLSFYIQPPLFGDCCFIFSLGATTALQVQQTDVIDVNAAVTLAPLFVNFKFAYKIRFTKFSFTPYAATSLGAIIANTTGINARQENVDNFTIDLGYKFAAGFTVKQKRMRKVGFFFETSFMVQLQKVTGYFLIFSAGATYRI